MRLLAVALGLRELAQGVTALAAERRVKRKRKVPLAKSEKQIKKEKREWGDSLGDPKGETQREGDPMGDMASFLRKGVLARDLAVALKVSEEASKESKETFRARAFWSGHQAAKGGKAKKEAEGRVTLKWFSPHLFIFFSFPFDFVCIF